MFRVKICGVTSVEDAVCAVEAGADAIGLNFYEKSPRFIAVRLAYRVSRAASELNAIPVGVFVNHSYEEVQHAERLSLLDAIQLHGDEPPDFAAKFIPPVIRARRFSNRSWEPIVADLAACRSIESRGLGIQAVLLDASAPDQYGGTGARLPWHNVADHKRWLGDVPLILAGGLTPDNVAEAIQIVRPAAVDVASGVESAPGKKDPTKVRDFVANALGAFGALGS